VRLPSQRAALLVAALLFLAAEPLVLTGCGGGGDEPAPAAGAGEATPQQDGTLEASGDETTDQEEGATPLRRRTVEIYFPSAHQNGLVGELREIFDTVTPGDRAKQIIADLISGPESGDALGAIPSTTRLRQAYVLDNGLAYLDFSSELRQGVGGGSMEEILTVYSIVDSIVINIPEIDRVAILINGRAVTTLNGHLDLRRPLRPDVSLILGSIIVSNPGDGIVRVASAASGSASE
jgi:hypothetical protein